MSPVRLFGDPFAGDPAAAALRAFLHACLDSCVDAAICHLPEAMRPRSEAAVARAQLADVERARIGAALERPLPATALVVVFAPAAQAEDWRQLASFRWPQACRVLLADAQSPEALLTKVRAELRWAGSETPEHGVRARPLQPWLALPAPAAHGPVLHLASGDEAAGTDVLVRTFAARVAPTGRRLRIVLPAGGEALVAGLRQLAAASAPAGFRSEDAIEFVPGPVTPALAQDCAAIAQPMRRLHDAKDLVCLLASGRPVIATASRESAAVFGDRAAFAPVGGAWADTTASGVEVCEPDGRSLAAALHALLSEPQTARELGRRGRAHAITERMGDRPAAPPRRTAAPAAAVGARRATVVLEAPFLASGAQAEVGIATARALLQRGNVDLHLLPTAPFARGVSALRAQAPELAPLLTSDPGVPDLWLAAGPSVRAVRPRCGSFAQRFDWEYGALPTELSPLLPQEIDRLIVHSTHVQRTVADSGRSPAATCIVPHGVDREVFHEQAPPLAEVVAWKGRLPAVLFAGSLTFRKGFDLFLRAVLDAAQRGHRFCVVVKGCGSDAHGGQGSLGGLIERFQRTPGAPPLLQIERELTRAEVAGLYRACDVLLHPYRGEGFGLQVLEARACGLPVLVTKGGATDDFAKGPGVRTVDARRRPVAAATPHLAQPWLLEPDGEQVAHRLGELLAELPEWQRQARGEAAAVRLAFGWDAAAAAIEQMARVVPIERPAKPSARPAVAPLDTARL